MALQEVAISKQEHTAGWLSIFPADIKTLQGSKIFVKQLTALAFSCISYMRSIFPEYAYQPREIDEVKLKVLSGDYDCKDAYLMTRWIKSAFDALDNQYMKELVLEILSLDNKILEYYAISYKYNDNEATCSFAANSQNVDFDNLKLERATKDLIKTLLTSTEDLEGLPRKYQLQLRVNYYDEVTPSHYKPKYFDHANPCDYEEINNFVRKELGSVQTPHHTLSIYTASTLLSIQDHRQKFFDNTLVEPSTNIVDESEASEMEQTPVTQPFQEANSEKSDFSWGGNEEDPTQRDTQIVDPSQPTLSCICKLQLQESEDPTNVSSSSSLTFQCIHCKSHHHLVCYKKLIGIDEMEHGCCYNCAKLISDAECTDTHLKDCKPRKAEQVAVFRQFLVYLQSIKEVNFKTLKDFGVPQDIIPSMINKLKKDKIIRAKKGSKDSHLINTAKLKSYIKIYFQV